MNHQLFLLLASLATAFVADARASTSCSSTPLSCTSAARGLDSCCTPTYGNLVLEQQWIPGYGPEDAFTLHGLWPNTCSGAQGPKNGCDDTRQYTDISSYFDSSLLNEMNTFWPSDQGDNNQFWIHEWQKHGTCVSTLAPDCLDSSNYNTGDEVPLYFGKALELRGKYDIYAAMSKAGYGTSSGARDGFNTDDVVAAIRRAYGVTVQLSCKGSAINGVRMWFDVQGADGYVPVNAPTSQQKCRGTIYLPSKGGSSASSGNHKRRRPRSGNEEQS